MRLILCFDVTRGRRRRAADTRACRRLDDSPGRCEAVAAPPGRAHGQKLPYPSFLWAPRGGEISALWKSSPTQVVALSTSTPRRERPFPAKLVLAADCAERLPRDTGASQVRHRRLTTRYRFRTASPHRLRPCLPTPLCDLAPVGQPCTSPMSAQTAAFCARPVKASGRAVTGCRPRSVDPESRQVLAHRQTAREWPPSGDTRATVTHDRYSHASLCGLARSPPRDPKDRTRENATPTVGRPMSARCAQDSPSRTCAHEPGVGHGAAEDGPAFPTSS